MSLIKSETHGREQVTQGKDSYLYILKSVASMDYNPEKEINSN